MTKLMANEHKELKKEGESDYDYLNDVLFFKVKDREYSRSVELDNIVVDVDEEDFIVGAQIFEASKFLAISKDALKNVLKWQFQATVNRQKLELRLVFQTNYRNKIIEPRPIIIEQLKEPLPNSQVWVNTA